MTENNNDKFWESNDDFWNKPVASEDWLKNEKQNTWQNRDVGQENPYLNKEAVSYEFQTQQTLQTKQTQQMQQATVLNGQVIDKPKKKIHVHTIICLIFIILAIVSVAGTLIAHSVLKKSAIRTANQVSYTETEIDSTFVYDENNQVTFDKEAVSFVSEENFTGFPENQKMIGIYLEVDSNKYVSGANVLHDIYLGYEIDGRFYYQEIPRQDVIYPYALSQGFAREDILEGYGLGNGIDDKGYLFFFVPSEVQEVTLYLPKTVKEHYIDVIETVYYVLFPVVDGSKEAEE